MIRGGDSRLRANGRAALRAALACLVIALAAATPPAFAAEEETHVFDAALSLTGNCETSNVDPVPDPSCPAEAPDGAFSFPLGVTTDAYGDLYYFGKPSFGAPDHIYVFSPSGHFLLEVPSYAALEGDLSLAVDASGDLYVAAIPSQSPELYVLKPSVYDPEAGKIAYDNPPIAIPTGSSNPRTIAVEQTTGRVLAATTQGEVAELGSYAEGNPVLRTFGAGILTNGIENIVVDHHAGRIYVAGDASGGSGAYPSVIWVFDREGNWLETMTGIQTAEGFHKFIAPFGQLGIAVDESTGHLFVSDLQNNPKPSVYEVDAAGHPVSTIRHSFQPPNGSDGMAIDNGVHSPNSAMNPQSSIAKEENPHGSYLFVPSGDSGTGHLFAFAPKPVPKPPLISQEGFTGVSNSEAVIEAKINPEGLATGYRFEYVEAATFEADVEAAGAGHGFDHAVSVGAGTLEAGNEAVSISAALENLEPGTAYRFRVVAANACEGEVAPACVSEGQAVGFATYPLLSQTAACANQALRGGLSPALPDCRAYELVTPANTNGHAPFAPTNNGAGPKFATPPVTARGDAVGFVIKGGAIPGYAGTGAFNGDAYVATRTAAGGWHTASEGPTGDLSTNPNPGGFSPDLRYVAWYTGPEDFGSLAIGEKANYIHYPDGSEHLVGEGSLGTDLQAEPSFIGEGAAHIVFSTAHSSSSHQSQQLEPDAPPSGTAAIYDRTPDGVVHVVSLLPGDVTPAAGQNAKYEGAAAQGAAVAFRLGEPATHPLDVRLDDAKTLEAAGPGSTFEGLSQDGRYTFYLAGGDLYRFDAQTDAPTRITETGDVTVVNVPAQGTAAYFVSPSAIAGSGANPNGVAAVAGEENFYYWDGSAVRFVATLTARDVKGEFVSTGSSGSLSDALGGWVGDLPDSLALDPSRTTPDGAVIVFESTADLAGYRSGGDSEIYRYDAAEASLACVSCDPTLARPSGDARLQRIDFTGEHAPTDQESQVPNLSANGRRAFFESPDPLVAADTDGVRDVYEWEADGEGSCATAGGCVFLISSGQSAHDNYLYGVSESGGDVFIYTTDLLTPEDGDETPSIYDARVEGGFPQAAVHAAECLGEACQPAAAPSIAIAPASVSFQGAGNVRPQAKPPACPAGRRKLRARGKTSCVRARGKRHAGKKHKRRGGRAGRRSHGKRGGKR